MTKWGVPAAFDAICRGWANSIFWRYPRYGVRDLETAPLLTVVAVLRPNSRLCGQIAGVQRWMSGLDAHRCAGWRKRTVGHEVVKRACWHERSEERKEEKKNCWW